MILLVNPCLVVPHKTGNQKCFAFTFHCSLVETCYHSLHYLNYIQFIFYTDLILSLRLVNVSHLTDKECGRNKIISYGFI